MKESERKWKKEREKDRGKQIRKKRYEKNRENEEQNSQFYNLVDKKLKTNYEERNGLIVKTIS